MASGFLNMISYWLFAASSVVMITSLFVETGPASGGWTVYLATATYDSTNELNENPLAEPVVIEWDGENYDEAYAHAVELMEKSGAVYIHAYDDDAIMAGQGTIGLEILEDLPDVDVIVVPVGGGGLIAGVALAIKALRPNLSLYIDAEQLTPGHFWKMELMKGLVSSARALCIITDGWEDAT
jgi:hypothetical protein